MSEISEAGVPEAAERPALRVVRGKPAPEELAAVSAVLTAAAGSGPGGSSAGPVEVSSGRWAAPARAIRRPLRAGPGAWAASARG